MEETTNPIEDITNHIDDITNLIDGISFTIGAKKPTQTYIDDQQKREVLEAKFVDYYENESKTGFYIRTNPEDADSEEVQFFNYNQMGGWWMKLGENQYVFFDSDAVMVKLTPPEELNKEKYTLKQFATTNEQAEVNFNAKDYALIVVLSDKDALDKFKGKMAGEKYQNLALSVVKQHEASENDFRLTVFIGKYNEFKGDKTITLSDLLKEIQGLTKKLAVTCVVKEEIKMFFDDFEEETRTIITDYTQEHRYECLYDSESDHSEKSSNDDDDDNDDEEEHKHSKEDGEEDEDQSEEEGSEDDEEDNAPQQVFVEKKV